MNRLKKVLIAGATLATVAALSLAVLPGNVIPSASAKGGGGHGGTPPPATPVLSDFGPVGSLTPQGVYSYIQANDPGLAATVTQIQTNAPTDLHFLADINATNGIAVCNELSAYVYADPLNANVRIMAQGHVGALWGFRDGVNGTCSN